MTKIILLAALTFAMTDAASAQRPKQSAAGQDGAKVDSRAPMPHELPTLTAQAQTSNLSDETVCRRALNVERSGWVKDSFYSDEAARRGLTVEGCLPLLGQLPPATSKPPAGRSAEDQNRSSSEPLQSYTNQSHPSFLEAGIFFMTGEEPPDRVKFQVRPDGAVSAIVIRTMLEPNRSAYNAIWEYKLRLDKSCTIMAYRIQPPYAIERLEFNNLPSPRAMRTDPKHSPIYANVMDLPGETWCHSQAHMNQAGAIDLVKNTTMCDTAIAIGHVYKAQRRLAALDYIRTNYCPGQPEPTPPPRKPY